jgi:hypothetical protein
LFLGHEARRIVRTESLCLRLNRSIGLSASCGGRRKRTFTIRSIPDFLFATRPRATDTPLIQIGIGLLLGDLIVNQIKVTSHPMLYEWIDIIYVI